MNYSEYKKQEEKTDSEQPKVQFMGNFLKADGASVIVRFPYSKSDDFNIETVHEVPRPDSQYPQRVECTMEKDGKCPLCDSNAKKLTRFLVKAVAYVVNNTTNTVDLIPVVWDRPAKYADELADKMADYGDDDGLRNCLFKIKRNGTKTDTTYSTSIITNKTIYKDEIYVKDFSSVDELNPSFLLIKRLNKYLGNNQTKEEKPVEEEPTEVKEVPPVAGVAPVDEAPAPKNEEVRTNPSDRRPVKRFANIK